MKSAFSKLFVGLAILIIVVIPSCNLFEESIQPPEIQTIEVTEVTYNSAISGGNITNDGGADVTARGMCWAVHTSPTVSDSLSNNGSGTGIFTATLTDLLPQTIYYVRAWATNSEGTAYGEEFTFTTLQQPLVPSVTTAGVTDIGETTAVCGGNVTSDGSSSLVAVGVCWSTAEQPTVDDNKTIDGTSTGEFLSSITALARNKTYYVRAYATNSLGTGYGEEYSFTTLPSPTAGTVTDIQGNTYTTDVFGTQVWMTQNLRTIRYNDNTDVPIITDDAQWSNLSTGGFSVFNNDIDNYYGLYGALYNWYAVQTGKLCPSGWHVPTDDEWKTLEMNLGMSQTEADGSGTRGTTEGGEMKESGLENWAYPNTGATNESNFTGLPAGIRRVNGVYAENRTAGYFWSATDGGELNAWARLLSNSNSNVSRGQYYKQFGMSVRCVQD
ncbi:MAG: fibrobacter succinogenes major paralogous domain-containing protein [Bacteroidales bacterium]|nr:fibrobacter succinogenes major paralogous domain-containing protein [Bacteroidales bacterium]HOY38846.1 fibrobacter succinogenes major paralogous domain-containing protein [Bacteroidales bacterium]HQP03982.1 fibrobacter succinogenes major paralogous domain-containing protein [Bacteroidales bacterium]